LNIKQEIGATHIYERVGEAWSETALIAPTTNTVNGACAVNNGVVAPPNVAIQLLPGTAHLFGRLRSIKMMCCAHNECATLHPTVPHHSHMTDDALQPDPSLIGGVPKPPLAFLPEPVKLFQARARRFAFLAEGHDLAAYLTFLAELSRLQARLAATLPALAPLPPEWMAKAADGGMPPIDRSRLVDDPALAATLQALLVGAAELDMPEAGREALDAVRMSDTRDRQWLLGNVLADDIPADAIAPHLFVAAAVQVHLSRLAATLDAAALTPVAAGVCPACGGRPATSSVTGAQGIENVRYASCGGCATRWNEVRVKCLCCGSTKGISYRSVGTDEATVKAELCSECKSWVKILYQVRNASLDPVADDVGSLGLDMLMRDADFTRGSFNPFIVGY